MGLNDMHSVGVVHRDLKHTNVLVHEIEGQLSAKIADFGLACVLKNRESVRNISGTVSFMAPEVL